MSEAPKSRKNAKLVIPYAHVSDVETRSRNAVTQIIPIIAMFLKSKPLSWASLIVSITAWLDECQATKDGSTAIMQVLTSIGSVAVSYMDFFFYPKIAVEAAVEATQ